MPAYFALCESAAHVACVQARHPHAEIVAVAPAAAWYCRQLGLSYLKLETPAAHEGLNAMADAVHVSQYRWARWVDKTMHAQLQEFECTGFFPARQMLFNLKRRIDPWIRSFYLLSSAVESWRPDKLIVFQRPAFFPESDSLTHQRHLYALAASALAAQGCPVEVWPETLDGETGKARQPFGIRAMHARAIAMRRQLRWGRERLMFFLQCRDVNATRGRIAWIGGGGDLSWILPHLSRQGFAMHRCVDCSVFEERNQESIKQMQQQMEGQWKILRASEQFWDCLGAQSTRLQVFVEPFLHYWAVSAVPRAWGAFLGSRAWFIENKFSAVAAQAAITIPQTAVFAAAASVGIPRIIVLHNPPGGPIDYPVHDCQDSIQSDCYLVGGEADAAYFKSLSSRFGVFAHAQPIAVGSARMDAIRTAPSAVQMRHVRSKLTGKNRQPLILYVPTMLYGPNRYFNEGSFSDVEYFELLERILPIFTEFPVRLLYKPFPWDLDANPIVEVLKRRVPNCRMIEPGEGALTRIMWAVDAIVVDFPSTALPEVLLTDKPVVCYAGMGWARLFPQARQALAKRVELAEDADAYEALLRRFLVRADFSPIANPDDEFLRLYATHRNDGRSAERAAGVISRLAIGKDLPLKQQEEPENHGRCAEPPAYFQTV